MLDIIKYLKKYPQDNPFRVFVENAYNENHTPRIPEGVVSLNALQPLFRVLQTLKCYSVNAFNSFVSDKLAAKKGKVDFDEHNFISALCELSFMYAFVSASDQPDSFQYEPRLIEGSNKNIEFSIVINGLRYDVEVKSANMIKQTKEFVDNMEKSGVAIEPHARMLPYNEWKNIPGDTPLMGSQDNKVADFIESAQEKFPKVTDSIHLLVICWDGQYRKALTALKSENSGLLTTNTYRPDLKYDHISHVIVTSQYGFLFDWMRGELPQLYAQDPINLRYAYNFIIDYNINKPNDIKDRLKGILGCEELTVVDENYVENNCYAVSFSVDLPIQNRIK